MDHPAQAQPPTGSWMRGQPQNLCGEVPLSSKMCGEMPVRCPGGRRGKGSAGTLSINQKGPISWLLGKLGGCPGDPDPSCGKVPLQGHPIPHPPLAAHKPKT